MEEPLNLIYITHAQVLPHDEHAEAAKKNNNKKGHSLRVTLTLCEHTGHSANTQKKQDTPLDTLLDTPEIMDTNLDTAADSARHSCLTLHLAAAGTRHFLWILPKRTPDTFFDTFYYFSKNQ